MLKTAFCFSLLFSLATAAQKVNTYIHDCVVSGQNLIIGAQVSQADATTWYRWQYKTPSGAWTCFVNGINNINSTNFTVSGATGTGANNAPALTIYSATVALEDVIVRVVMAKNADPCSNPAPSQIWNADADNLSETKYLRLHVVTNALGCPPNAYSCPGNILVNNGKFYGGFENTIFDQASETYQRNNFGPATASSDFSFGSGNGRYQDINNPYAMNTGFVRNLAPHTGDYQMVVEGSLNNSDRIWHKSINVLAGRQYAFSAWIARVDNTEPIIELWVNNSILVSTDMSFVQIGEWNLIQGTFAASTTGPVNFNIRDGQAGGNNNYTLDDICIRECNNCSILELHQLYLSASLSKEEVKMKWIAENEMGTANFMIERSVDGIHYEKIGSKPSSGPVNTPTAYYFTDNVQNMGVYTTLSYRIKALDSDGRYAYSNVVIIRLGKIANVLAWPAPFTDLVNISYSATTNSKVNVRLCNMEGKIVKQASYSVTRGLNQLTISDLQQLSSGIYFIHIADMNTNQVYTRKLSK